MARLLRLVGLVWMILRGKGMSEGLYLNTV